MHTHAFDLGSESRRDKSMEKFTRLSQRYATILQDAIESVGIQSLSPNDGQSSYFAPSQRPNYADLSSLRKPLLHTNSSCELGYRWQAVLAYGRIGSHIDQDEPSAAK